MPRESIGGREFTPSPASGGGLGWGRFAYLTDRAAGARRRFGSTSGSAVTADARAAIKASDYTRAESLINDAEKLGVKYNPLTDRWSDTPDVLRKLLATERAKANATKPGSRAPALLGGISGNQAKPIPADPMARLDAADDQLTAINYAATTVQIAFDNFYLRLNNDQKARFESPAR